MKKKIGIGIGTYINLLTCVYLIHNWSIEQLEKRELIIYHINSLDRYIIMYTSKTCGTSNIIYRYNIVHKSGKDLWREKYVYPS